MQRVKENQAQSVTNNEWYVLYLHIGNCQCKTFGNEEHVWNIPHDSLSYYVKFYSHFSFVFQCIQKLQISVYIDSSSASKMTFSLQLLSIIFLKLLSVDEELWVSGVGMFCNGHVHK